MRVREAADAAMTGQPCPEQELAAVPAQEETVRLKLEADFTRMRDTASFYYYKKGDKPWQGHWEKLGFDHRLYFRLDHFTGCRFGLTMYSTREKGGCAIFSNFVYRNR